MTCRHPGKSLGQALHQQEHHSLQCSSCVRKRPGCTSTRQTRECLPEHGLCRGKLLRTAGKHDSQACFDARQSRIALTYREAELHGIVRRLSGMDGIVVARAGSTAMDQTMGADSPARVDGRITKSRNDVEANLPDLGTDRNGSRGEDIL